jgi:hypothetical protein
VKIAVLLMCVAVIGCTNPWLRQMNTGAQVPVYIGSRSALRAEAERRGSPTPPFPQVVAGWTDRNRKQIAIAWSPDPDPLARELGAWTNEFCHLIDLCGGNYWQAAYLVSGGNLQAMCADAPPEAQATWLALDEARKAASR